jgi:protein O-GlcNAc transferase
MANFAEMMRRAEQLRQSGDLAQATAIYQTILENDRSNAEVWWLLGATLSALGRWEDAVGPLRETVQLAPNHVEANERLALALAQTGRHDEAIAIFQQVLKQDPNRASACDHLGTALAKCGRFDEACACFQAACEISPANAEFHFKLGVVRDKRGRYTEAVESFRQAMQRAPERVDIQRNLALALLELGRFDEAVIVLQQALKRQPRYPEGLNALGIVSQKQGQLEAAATAFQQAILLKPDYTRAFGNLRNTFRQLGKIEEAVAHCRRTIERHPDSAVAYNSLGTLLLLQDKVREAEVAFQQALLLKPDFAAAVSNLGHVYRHPGQLDRSIECYRQAIALEPGDPMAHSNLIYVMHFHPGCDLPALAAEGARWRQRHADPLKKFIRPHANSRDPERRLKIGYVSSNFYRQAECFFVVPLLEHHDRRSFEIHCYASVTRPDAVTTRLQNAADAWHDVQRMSNETLVEKIRDDKIDILVDLEMHMGNKRLTMFARKPAPVQVTWLAYPGSTGLDTIDYRLTDAYMEPADADDSWSSETPVRLPDCWCCYEPVGEYPEINALPALEKKHVTFASFNTPMKNNEATLRIWADALAAVSESRLLLLGPDGPWQEYVRSVISAAGVAGDRVNFVKPCPWVDYMKLYHEVDICFDPLPYNGITTTCDALWMGVPVVSLVGNTPAGRAGLGLLRTVGLPELVAASKAEFVSIACNLANDLPWLAELRATLRPRMQSSPLMDAPRFARHVEHAYRKMWRRWCDSADMQENAITSAKTQ